MNGRVKCKNCIFFEQDEENEEIGSCNLPYLHNVKGVSVVGSAITRSDYHRCGKFVDKETNMSYRDTRFSKGSRKPNHVCCEKDKRIYLTGVTAIYESDECPIHGDPNKWTEKPKK